MPETDPIAIALAAIDADLAERERAYSVEVFSEPTPGCPPDCIAAAMGRRLLADLRRSLPGVVRAALQAEATP